VLQGKYGEKKPNVLDCDFGGVLKKHVLFISFSRKSEKNSEAGPGSVLL
jgi:hypothetical protein